MRVLYNETVLEWTASEVTSLGDGRESFEQSRW